MPSDPDAATLRDILFHIDAAQRFARDQTYESLNDDLMRRFAITRCLEIISEASRRLSAELKARHPAIPWQAMAAAGNFYRHEYEDVTPHRIWLTLQEDIPLLRAMVERELDRF